MSSWYVYMLRCADNTLYTGIAKDVEKRVRSHIAGRGAKYTRGRLPVDLLYREKTASHAEAARREREIKKLSRRQKLLLIASASALAAAE